MVREKVQHIIKLNPAEVKNFVKEAEKCNFDVDIAYGHVVVDAKSILGVFGLDLTKNLTVSFYGQNEEFENYLEQMAA